MTTDAIQVTTEALKGLLETTIGPGQVFAGPPSDPQASAGSAASLFLYHLVPNAELRNELSASGLRPPNGPILTNNSIPLDLRYLITVFRPAGADPNASPVELLTLGEIIQTLQTTPVLTGARLPGQTVRLTPDPVSMEEISRVWGLFPETAYRTSVVYLATPVFVDAREVQVGPRVSEVHRQAGKLEKLEIG